MEINIDLKPDAINQAIVDAIVKSTVGQQLTAAIEKALKNGETFWNNAFERIVKEHIDRVIGQRIGELIDPKCRELAAKLLTTDSKRLEQLVEAATSTAIEKIMNAYYRDH